MMKQRSKLSLIAAIAILFVVLISSFFVAEQINHNCTGEDCAICYEIRVCQEAIRKLTRSCVAGMVILLLYVCTFMPAAQSRPAVCHTLVSLKVKLSD